jgi:hypothetical protein
MLFYMIDILRAAQSCLQLYSLEPSKAPPQEAHKPPSLQPRALQGTGRGLYGQALKNPLSLLAACPELNTTRRGAVVASARGRASVLSCAASTSPGCDAPAWRAAPASPDRAAQARRAAASLTRLPSCCRFPRYKDSNQTKWHDSMLVCQGSAISRHARRHLMHSLIAD